jgi:hypothetical protein
MHKETGFCSPKASPAGSYSSRSLKSLEPREIFLPRTP